MRRPPTPSAIPGWPPTPGPRTETSEILLYAAGVVVTFLIGFVARELVLSAWDACADTDAGERFGATLEVLGGIGLFGTVAFAVVVRRMQLAAKPIRLLFGCLAVAIVGLALITILVPYPGFDPQSTAASADYPSCGPGALPTWWPFWLPS
jgi:hypothetical protein